MGPRGTGVRAVAFAAALLAAACGGGPATPGGAGADEGEVAWRHLGMVEAILPDQAAGAVLVDEAALADAWDRYGFVGDVPEVRFADHVVLLLGQPDDACPDELIRLETVDGRLDVGWLPPPGGCNEPLILRLHAVEVHRAHLPAEVEVRPEAPFEDTFTAVTLQIPTVEGAAPPPPAPPRAMTDAELAAVFAGHAVARCGPEHDPLGTPEVDGPVSDDPTVAEAQHARAGFGVPSDIDTTSRVLASPDRDDTYGIPLTRAEIAADTARSNLASDVADWLMSNGWDVQRDVTVRIERHGDGRVHVTADAERVAALQAGLDERFGPGVVVAEDDGYPPAAVADAMTALQALLGPGQGPGTITSLSGAPGPVMIGMIDPTRAALDRIAATVDPRLVCVDPQRSGVPSDG